MWIPVSDDDHFRYGVWVEVSEDDFWKIDDLWEDPRLLELTVDGTLDTDLPDHRGSRGVPARLRWRDLETQPAVEILDGSHPLALEQRDGISERRADELAAPFFHGA